MKQLLIDAQTHAVAQAWKLQQDLEETINLALAGLTPFLDEKELGRRRRLALVREKLQRHEVD